MGKFQVIHSDEYLTEAKSYSINNAKKYGLEKAIIINTLNLVSSPTTNKLISYFPEFTPEEVKKHLDEMKELGIISYD